jgi:hypothetical protein
MDRTIAVVSEIFVVARVTRVTRALGLTGVVAVISVEAAGRVQWGIHITSIVTRGEIQ